MRIGVVAAVSFHPDTGSRTPVAPPVSGIKHTPSAVEG